MRKKDAALVEAALFSAALGGSCKFMSLGIHDIGWNRFQKTSGVVLFGLSCGKMARDAAFLEGVSDCKVNFLIRGESARGGERMSGWKDKGVGEVFSVFDEASSRKAANHRAVCGGKLGFLKVSDRGARLIPRVDAKNGGLDLAQEGFIDGHIAGGGGGGVK